MRRGGRRSRGLASFAPMRLMRGESAMCWAQNRHAESLGWEVEASSFSKYAQKRITARPRCYPPRCVTRGEEGVRYPAQPFGGSRIDEGLPPIARRVDRAGRVGRLYYGLGRSDPPQPTARHRPTARPGDSHLRMHLVGRGIRYLPYSAAATPI